VHTFSAHILIEHSHVLHRFGVAHELGVKLLNEVAIVFAKVGVGDVVSPSFLHLVVRDSRGF